MRILRQVSTILRGNPAACAESRLPKLLARNRLETVHNVLEIGCRSGLASQLFPNANYLGLDLDANRIRRATRRFGQRFQQADFCRWDPENPVRFDFILMNTVLSHLDTRRVHRILGRARRWLDAAGHVHILDQFTTDPARRGWLADAEIQLRSLATWSEILGQYFKVAELDCSEESIAGIETGQLFYFKGGAKSNRLKSAPLNGSVTVPHIPVLEGCDALSQ